MGSWVILSILILSSPGIHGASLPYHDGYDWHFNQMGVHLDLALKDQTNPLVGGKAHVELPISAIWKLIEGENQMMETLVIALEKTVLGKLYDVKTVKADITYSAEKVLEGIYTMAVDYTLVHKDGTEEKATVILQGKNESGMIIISLEVIPENLIDTAHQIILPIQLTVACSWPNAHALTITGCFGKILINISNDANEVSARGMWEYLGHQYKYTSVLSIKEKFFTLTCQDPTEQPNILVLKLKFVNSMPRLEITGQVPTTRWFQAGAIKLQLIQNNLYDYEIKHTYNGLDILNYNIALTNGKMDMTLKYFTKKTQIIIEYTKTMIKVVFPTTYSNNKMLEIELKFQPTNNARLLEGGNIKIMASQDSMPIIKIGGYFGLTINAAKYEILLSDCYVNVMDGALKTSFSEVKLFGKIFIDRVYKNILLPKISVEAMFEKDQTEMFNVLLTTVETPYKIRIYCPYILKNILNIHNIEYLEIMHSHVVIGKETTITTICNFTSKKLIAKISPTMITYEIFDGEVSLVKYLNQLTKMEVGTNSYFLEGKTSLHLNENSYIYKVLSYLPTSLYFKDLTTNYHLEVVDNAARKVNVKVHMTKDTLEILHVEVNNVQVPYKISLKAQVLPLEIFIEYDLSTKEWRGFINKKSLLKVKPTVGNQYQVEVNGVPLVQVALLNKQVQISTITKIIPVVTAIITLKTFSIFENTVGFQLIYKQIAHKTLLGWNINQLKKAFVDIKVTGSGTDLLGNYEIIHHLNWYITDIKNFDFKWNGKVLSTGLACLKTPLVTDGKLKINDYAIKMKLVENYNNEPYTLILKTKPLKIALLPFFMYP